MKTTRYLSTALLLCLYPAISNICVHPDAKTREVFGIFEATTPCNSSVLSMLQVSSGANCEMMKWKLTLYKEANMQSPSSFELDCTYGVPKQGTRGFVEGTKTMQLKGKCSIEQGIAGNAKATVYKMAGDNNVTLSFFRPDQNILHLLAGDKSLVVGSAAWSYTLSRKEPVYGPGKTFSPVAISQMKLSSRSSIIGTFEGRAPCTKLLKDLHGITSANCGLVKCQLKLFLDSIMHTPSRFILNTIYVGFGDDNRYMATGTWKVLQGTVADPTAIVYQLTPEKARSGSSILLQKADDNILFFLDNNTHLLAGNEYVSYTLNKKQNK